MEAFTVCNIHRANETIFFSVKLLTVSINRTK